MNEPQKQTEGFMKQECKKNRQIRKTKHLNPMFPCFGFPVSCYGFTLIEILVTLVVLGLMAVVVGTTLSEDYESETACEQTIEIMDQVRQALLGKDIYSTRGIHISGYVADMGGLPALNDNGQPEALWVQTQNLESRQYYSDENIWAGWNGPYITVPDTGFLTDGWGNALCFNLSSQGTLTVTSFGADMKRGGSGLDQDIVITIQKYQYLSPIGFSFRGRESDLDNSSFTIHYPDSRTGALTQTDLTPESTSSGTLEFGCFLSDGEDNPLFPIGLRSITATIKHGSSSKTKQVIPFSVQSGMNYIGILE